MKEPERKSKLIINDEFLPQLTLPDIDQTETKSIFIQPPNRQYIRWLQRTRVKLEDQVARAEFRSKIVPRINPNPTKLHTAVIHEIYKKNHISIHRFNNKCQTTRRFKNILLDRRDARKAMENESRRVNFKNAA